MISVSTRVLYKCKCSVQVLYASDQTSALCNCSIQVIGDLCKLRLPAAAEGTQTRFPAFEVYLCKCSEQVIVRKCSVQVIVQVPCARVCSTLFYLVDPYWRWGSLQLFSIHLSKCIAVQCVTPTTTCTHQACHIPTHKDATAECQFQCSICNREFDSKRSVSNHHSKMHGPTQTQLRTASAGSFQCEFCNQYHPTNQSLSQHIHNQHPAEASAKQDREASQTNSRHWQPSEHAQFLDALQKDGPTSNITIANYI